MYKRLFNAIVTGVGFTLLFATCNKTLDNKTNFTTSISVKGTSIEKDQVNTDMYYSTDNGATFLAGVPNNIKLGQTFKVKVFDNTSSEFLTSATFTPDWSSSNPSPSDPSSDTPEFTYNGSNVIKVSFSNKHCTYDASFWTGAWRGDEVGTCCGGTDANNITQDASNPSRFTMDNFSGDHVDAYFVLTPSTNYHDQIVTLPRQTTNEGGVASGNGTYDQCAGTFTIAVEYTFPGLTDLGILALGRGNSSGSSIYAATNSTFFFSADGGSSWTPQSTSLAATPVRAIATPHATANANVFVATGSGVFHSADRGVTWAAANSGLGNTNVTALIMNGNTLIATTNGGGVFTSTNNASSWTASNTGITNLSLISLAASGSDVYTAAVNGGAFHSADGGATWSPIATSIKNTFSSLAAVGTKVYAGTSHGIFQSTDNGLTWTAVSTYVTDPANNNVNVTDLDIRAITVQGSTDVFAASGTGGVYHSTDDGATWTAVNSGLSSLSSVSLESATTTSTTNDPKAIRLFYGSSDGGAFVSTNQGKGWTNASSGAKYDFQYNFHKP